MGSETPMEKQSWLAENGREDEETTVEYSGKSNGTVHIRYGNRNCWSRRSTVERRLLVVIVVCLLLSLALLIALVVVSSQSDSADSQAQTEPGVCTDRECVLAAARVTQSINFEVEPCDDFYTFACGAWMEKNVIPEDKSEINTFGILRDQVEIILKNILEENTTYAHDEVLQKPKTLYYSCMDLERLEETGDAPLREFLKQFGGWPMLNDTWRHEAFNLTSMLIHLHLYNNDPLVDLLVGVDMKNSTNRILVLDQPPMGLPGRKYYQVERNDSILMAYEALMHNIAVALGGNPLSVARDVKDVMDFEIALANITVPDEDRRDSEALYNPYTLPQLAQNFTGPIEWLRLFHELFSHPDVQVELEKDEVIIVRSPAYITRLNQLLNDTSARTVANYLIWRITMNRAGSLNERYRDFFQDYQKVVYGTAAPRARFRICASYTTNVLGLAVGHMFVKEAFDEDSKHLAQEMIVELKKSFNELLDELDWMDDLTKKVAKEKNDHIMEKIGYPDELLNVTYLTGLFQNYTYTRESYFDNVVTNIEQSVRYNMRQLRDPIDREKWSAAPSTVNAYYNPQRNQIMFPAGILQPPFYKKTYPRSLNFGGIGVVIGHEITHGFDDRGRQHDKNGNLEQWWTDDAIAKFKERAQCIIDQYSNYTVPEAQMNLNGVNTQGENIADNGGLKQSFRAYNNWVKDHGEEPRLPGLPFDSTQLFFINFAQIWCSNMRRESAVNRIRTGHHSPGRFRVIGTLQNSDDFAKAFGCPLGTSYMNPEHKCRVW
ncbi:neprilysin-1-like [Littorina saxatilis]|uniref:neprilysin-1-like n=1 Tax=Littorina saxatilis TaxID=31220 RepID=UPI0038B4FAE1